PPPSQSCIGEPNLMQSLFDTPELLGASSSVFSAKYQRVPELRPLTWSVSVEPAVFGTMVSVMMVAEAQLLASIAAPAFFFTMYRVACPELPSSPGAVHWSFTQFPPAPVWKFVIPRSLTVPGEQLSAKRSWYVSPRLPEPFRPPNTIRRSPSGS